MSVRTTVRPVAFANPFTLPGLDRTYPAGTYLVSVDEEQLDLSFSAFRRVGTRIALTHGAVTESWPVDPADLDAALSSDAAKRDG
jgi:hypothetical protein